MTTMAELRDTQWEGTTELWLDPLGNEATLSDCTLSIEPNLVRYTWTYEGKIHQGRISLHVGGADFTDTWHQPQTMKCAAVPGGLGLFQVFGSYGPGADWHWKIGLCLRAPSNELVLQMTNIAPWGEEMRAVRMTCTRVS